MHKSERGIHQISYSLFMAPRVIRCAVCSEEIHVGEYYCRAEPANKKKKSFYTCLTCGGMQ